MSRFIKYIALLVGFLSLSTCSIAQMALAEMLRYGDQAFEQKNYGSAIHFYKMIIDEDLKVERISSHPYAYSVYTGKSNKKEIEKSDSTAVTDSVRISDSLSLPELDSSEVIIDEESFTENGDEKVDGNELYATHMIAECCRLMNDYSLAEYWYVQSLQFSWGAEVDTYPLDRYYYGTVLMNNSSYKQASEEFKTFRLDNEDTTSATAYFYDRAEQLISSCDYAQSSRSKKQGVSVKKGDTLINNGSSSYAASFLDYNHIIISSARNTSTEDKENKISGNLLSDIFLMTKNGKNWGGAQSLAIFCHQENITQ